jgi:hypothetical protein
VPALCSFWASPVCTDATDAHSLKYFLVIGWIFVGLGIGSGILTVKPTHLQWSDSPLFSYSLHSKWPKSIVWIWKCGHLPQCHFESQFSSESSVWRYGFLGYLFSPLRDVTATLHHRKNKSLIWEEIFTSFQREVEVFLARALPGVGSGTHRLYFHQGFSLWPGILIVTRRLELSKRFFLWVFGPTVCRCMAAWPQVNQWDPGHFIDWVVSCGIFLFFIFYFLVLGFELRVCVC